MASRQWDPFDLTPYRALRESGRTPQQVVVQALQTGRDRHEVWWILKQVYGFEHDMCKATWCDAHGIAIVPEYRQRLDDFTRQIQPSNGETPPKSTEMKD